VASSIILFAYKTRDVKLSDQASNMRMLRCFHPLMSMYKMRKMRFSNLHWQKFCPAKNRSKKKYDCEKDEGSLHPD